MTLTFIILILTIVLFVSGRLRSDLVALMSVLALFLTGIISTGEALSGFADATVIMIAALFVVGEGLSRSGVTAWLRNLILDLAGDSEIRLLIVMMIGTALLSAFISNTGTVATLLPAIVAAAWRIGSMPSKYLIPLAFAANTGGLLTLTGTPPNIIVANALAETGSGTFSYFEYALIGLPLLVTTIGFMTLFGRRLLPERAVDDRPEELETAMGDMSDSFDLEGKLYRLRVRFVSSLVKKSLAESGLRRDYHVSVLRLLPPPIEGKHLSPLELQRQKMKRKVGEWQPGQVGDIPGAETIIQANDILLVKGLAEQVEKAALNFGLEMQPVQSSDAELAGVLMSQETGVAEVIITPRSAYIGRTLTEGNFAEKFGVQVISIRRGDRPVSLKLTRLAFGDALLVRGTWAAIERLQVERRNFVVVGRPEALVRQVVQLTPQSILAVVALVGMVGLMVSGLVPTVIAALAAAVVMVLGGCLSMENAYRAISWQSVVLIACMIPLSIALQETGGVEFIADVLVNSLGLWGPLALLAGVFALTTSFSQVINNTATAVLMAPIVIQAAASLGISPAPLLMTVAVSASTAFLTPIGTTTNLMVMNSGGYQFIDYMRVGLPLLLLFLVVSIFLIPIIWPF